MLIKAALCHASSGGLYFLCVAFISASTKLSGETFAVQHSPYAVSKLELCRPSERGENGWEHLQEAWIWKKRQWKFKASKLGSHLPRTLGMHGGYQYIAQLSLSRVMMFFWLFVVVFSRVAVPYVLYARKFLKLPGSFLNMQYYRTACLRKKRLPSWAQTQDPAGPLTDKLGF